MCSAKYLSLVKRFLQSNSATALKFKNCIGQCDIISVSEGRIKVEFEVDEGKTNSLGFLHTGVTATMVDILSKTAGEVTKDGFKCVTVDMSINYLETAKIGDRVIADAAVISLEDKLGLMRANLYKKDDNQLIATAVVKMCRIGKP